MNAEGFFVVGATHHLAPIAVRERLALAPATEAELQRELLQAGAVGEIAVLSTCNRIEFYGVPADPAAVSKVENAFCARTGFAPADFAPIRMHREGIDAVRHLFEVAAGIDSQMVGENEIFGQVKEAYAAAVARRASGPILNRIFQKAFQAAKHVRTHTGIAAGQVSAASVAVELAQNVFGGLERVRLLLIGAGEIGEKTARAFQGRGVRALTVCSRHLERAVELSAALGASTLPFVQREARLGDFDVIVCATSAPGHVLAAPAVQAAMRRRPARPLLFLDLALPRDVDPSVAGGNVFVYNLDDLAAIADENRRARAAETERCRHLLAARADTLWRDLAQRTSQARPPPPPVRGPARAPQPDHPS